MTSHYFCYYILRVQSWVYFTLHKFAKPFNSFESIWIDTLLAIFYLKLSTTSLSRITLKPIQVEIATFIFHTIKCTISVESFIIEIYLSTVMILRCIKIQFFHEGRGVLFPFFFFLIKNHFRSSSPYFSK